MDFQKKFSVSYFADFNPSKTGVLLPGRKCKTPYLRRIRRFTRVLLCYLAERENFVPSPNRLILNISKPEFGTVADFVRAVLRLVAFPEHNGKCNTSQNLKLQKRDIIVPA